MLAIIAVCACGGAIRALRRERTVAFRRVCRSGKEVTVVICKTLGKGRNDRRFHGV